MSDFEHESLPFCPQCGEPVTSAMVPLLCERRPCELQPDGGAFANWWRNPDATIEELP